MQKKNDNFLEKIVKKDYNNELEAILTLINEKCTNINNENTGIGSTIYAVKLGDTK